MTFIEFIIDRGWNWVQLMRFFGTFGRLYLSLMISCIFYGAFKTIDKRPLGGPVSEYIKHFGKFFLYAIPFYMVGILPNAIFAFNTFGRRTQRSFWLVIVLYLLVGCGLYYKKKTRKKVIKIGDH